MTMNKDFWKIPWLSRDEKAGIHVLYLSCIRFVVGKYGGSMETDKNMRIAGAGAGERHGGRARSPAEGVIPLPALTS